MYLQNKYTSIYYAIINRAKSRDLSKDVYTEKHHIIPRSLGGSNSKNNLVNLTAREHRLCHLLLPKMTISEDHKGKTMPSKTDAQKKALSEKLKGRIMSEETKRKMSESRKAYWDSKRISDY